MDDSDEDLTNEDESTELDLKTRQRLVENEMRSFKTRGFHDGYDEGVKRTSQKAFDAGYKKAFEQNFILSTLKGVAHALQSSYNLTNRPTSTISSITSSSSSSSPSGRHHRMRSKRCDGGTSSSGSSSSNVSSSANSPAPCSNINVNISGNHLSILESMKFDDASDIESIKNDLIKICRENRLEILAHYVSQIG